MRGASSTGRLCGPGREGHIELRACIYRDQCYKTKQVGQGFFQGTWETGLKIGRSKAQGNGENAELRCCYSTSVVSVLRIPISVLRILLVYCASL